MLRISATPVSRGDHTEIIQDDEVIGAGLIAAGISINEGVSAAIEDNNNLDDDLLLLDLADKKRKEIQAEYDRRGLKIRPLVLIQFPNGYDEWNSQFESKCYRSLVIYKIFSYFLNNLIAQSFQPVGDIDDFNTFVLIFVVAGAGNYHFRVSVFDLQ